jgi:predicted RND superfamily exporter protein
MTRTEKWLVAIIVFLLVLLSAFAAEHIYIITDMVRHPPQVIEACPAPKPIHPN